MLCRDLASPRSFLETVQLYVLLAIRSAGRVCSITSPSAALAPGMLTASCSIVLVDSSGTVADLPRRPIMASVSIKDFYRTF